MFIQESVLLFCIGQHSYECVFLGLFLKVKRRKQFKDFASLTS